MAVICFSDKPDGTWSVAGWAFRQLLDDVISQYPEDRELVDKFEQSKTHGGLILYLLQPESALKIANAITRVAKGVLSGTILSGIVDQPYGDTATIEQYRSALEDLLSTVPRTGGTPS